jgi:hypothetical protein
MDACMGYAIYYTCWCIDGPNGGEYQDSIFFHHNLISWYFATIGFGSTYHVSRLGFHSPSILFG